MKIYEYKKEYESESKRWYSLGMREVFLYLIDAYKPINRGPLKIADVGCGTGRMLGHLERFGDVIGIEKSTEAIKFCRMRGFTNVICGDATSLSLRDSSVDLVTALGIIEHVKEDGALLGEISRICRSGGRIVIWSSAFDFLWSEHDEAGEHVRRYTVGELREKLARQNFKIIKTSYFNFSMFLPLLIFVNLKKLFKKNSQTEPQRAEFIVPLGLTYLLIALLKLEGRLYRWADFVPFGVNIICILEKR